MLCCNMRLTLLKFEEGFVAYLAVNTLRLHYKSQCCLEEIAVVYCENRKKQSVKRRVGGGLV
jgi:hypothetical protein